MGQETTAHTQRDLAFCVPGVHRTVTPTGEDPVSIFAHRDHTAADTQRDSCGNLDCQPSVPLRERRRLRTDSKTKQTATLTTCSHKADHRHLTCGKVDGDKMPQLTMKGARIRMII